MGDPIAAYSTAKGYVQSAYVLMANPLRYSVPDDTTFFMSFHMLCGFALELYFKAFLSHHGWDEKSLRSKRLRHNLRELHKEVVALGLTSKIAAQLLEVLAERHEDFTFRYVRRETKYLARDLQLIFKDFSIVDTIVDDAIGASASRGKEPGGFWAFPPEHAAWRFIGVTI